LSKTLYLVIMLGIIAVITIASVPSLFRKACPKCGMKNWLEAKACKQCGAPFPESES